MNNQLKSQVQKSKIRYILGIEAYSKKYNRDYIFDTLADYENCFSINEIIIFSIFKVPIYKIERKHDVIKHLLFGLKVKTVSVEEIYYKRNLKSINNEYDDAYILQGGSGEPFLWISYAAKATFVRNNSKKPLVVGTRSSFTDLVKMYLPDVSYVHNNRAGASFDTESSHIEYAGHRFYLTKSHQKHSIFLSFSSKDKPDLRGALNQFALDGLKKEELKFPKPFISTYTKESLAQKISYIDLNIDNFVILAPEANYFYEISANFWEDIVRRFNKLGVDVYLNFINQNNYISGCKTLSEPLTYSEVFELACRAKAVISLRNGFSETIVPTLTPGIVILTTTRDLFAQPDKDVKRDSNPLLWMPFIEEDLVRGVYYFDYDTNEAAADAVLSCYDEMIKNRASMKEG